MVSDASAALDALRRAAGDGTLDEICERNDVRVLSAFGSALTSAEPGDLDIGVGFRGPGGDVLRLLDDLTQLTAYDRLDVAVIDGAGPVLRARALSGLGLYESTAGIFATEQMAALAEERDTAWLRRLSLEAMTRYSCSADERQRAATSIVNADPMEVPGAAALRADLDDLRSDRR